MCDHKVVKASKSTLIRLSTVLSEEGVQVIPGLLPTSLPESSCVIIELQKESVLVYGGIATSKLPEG